jgi:hypothetical protein
VTAQVHKHARVGRYLTVTEEEIVTGFARAKTLTYVPPFTRAIYETVKIVVPRMFPEFAVIVELPAATAVATPALLIVATVVLLDVQVTELVTTLMDPSE